LLSIYAHIYRNFIDPIIHVAQDLEIDKPKEKHSPFAISMVLCLCLIGSYYLGNTLYFYEAAKFFGFKDNLNASTPNKIKLFELLWWLVVYSLFYVMIPLVVIKLYLKKPLTQFGLKKRGAFSNYKIYLWLFVFVLPFIFIASLSNSFKNQYPLYKIIRVSDLDQYFVLWEIAYVLQFFAIEFFFRGFILHGTKHQMGIYSIIISTTPYCMIHFQKPMPEAIAAIFAGFILSILSLKSHSIWLGVCLHACIALLMDFTSLLQRGLIF
jgi:uncharacterized protein